MNMLSKFFHALTDARPSRREREESYLAAAADLYDLERRMRQLERQTPALPLGLGLR